MAYTRDYPWVLFFKALSSHSSSKRLESWLEARLSPLFALYRLPLWTPFLIPTAQFYCFNSHYNGHQSTHISTLGQNYLKL